MASICFSGVEAPAEEVPVEELSTEEAHAEEEPAEVASAEESPAEKVSAKVASAMADASRLKILCALMDGRAWTATELSAVAHLCVRGSAAAVLPEVFS